MRGGNSCGSCQAPKFPAARPTDPERSRLGGLVARRGNLFPGFGGGKGGLAALLLDLVPDALEALLEFDDSLAQRTADLRQPLAEQQQTEPGDDQPFPPLRHPKGKGYGQLGSKDGDHGNILVVTGPPGTASALGDIVADSTPPSGTHKGSSYGTKRPPAHD